MHIKSLEICGFKSFVDRTKIKFDHDVIGIVGPNGCGKSNVVDAIRWVMGEQSAKALRGKAMGDVIFAGSDARQQAGFAEVTLTFDNGDPAGAQALPLEYRDYPEIAVTRRIFHGDGSNEYFINGAPVRLRDVTDVFLGTGVGRKAYSIVEQGKIGLIVTARPEDRRILIEEAAGITKYRARKRQAEQKMDATRQNLSRVSDIVSEIERQLDNLKRQAQKAKRYLAYRQELDDLALWDAAHRWLELSALSDVAERARTQAAARAEQERAEVAARDAEVEVTRQRALAAEQTAERAQTAAFSSDHSVREWEADVDRAQERYRYLAERLDRERDEQHAVESKAAELGAEREELDAGLSAALRAQQEQQTSVDAQAASCDELRRQSEQSARRLLSLRQREAETRATIARAEAALSSFEQRAAEAQSRHKRLFDELSRLNGEQAELETREKAATVAAAELREQSGNASQAKEALARELPLVQPELAAAEERLERKTTELHKKRSRLAALTELSERMEGLGAGVRSLLATGDAAIGGILADCIEVPGELTAAFAGLVGDRMQCVIVEDVDRALGLLRALAHDRRGRASIIPRAVASHLDSLLAAPLEALMSAPMATSAMADEGVLGLMIDFVRFAPADEGVLRALLGDTILVRTADDARRLSARRVGCDVVTLDGTVFHADGRITGGTGDAFAAGMLEHKREMRELGEQGAQLGAECEEQQQRVRALRDRLAKLREALDGARTAAHEAQIAVVTAEQDLRRIQQQLALTDRRRAEVAREIDELQAQAARAAEQEKATRAELDQALACREQTGAELGAAEEHDAAAQAELGSKQALLSELKVNFALLRERAHAARAALDRAAQQEAELVQRAAVHDRSRSEAAAESGVIAARMMQARGELIASRGEQRRARAEAEQARSALDEDRHSLALAESELKELRGRLNEASGELTRHEMEAQRLTIEKSHLLEAIRERHRGLELASVVGDFHARPLMTGEQKARIKELAALIERMGGVNLDAVREYEEQAERHAFYIRQQDDLDAALRDLEQAIGQMNRESKRLFQHAFEGINRRFIELFPKMFRGGKAELRLTDPNDLLETGIDILAQPPGKKLTNIELMSGGEKAFTAVSLLFAIFRYKPSPFCILDEVDAPLDDANIDRYAEAVRAMTDRSQFIIITHSKRTMQAVDVLYGVTMQEPGVSKLVGVRVNESATRSGSSPRVEDDRSRAALASDVPEAADEQPSGSDSDGAAVA